MMVKYFGRNLKNIPNKIIMTALVLLWIFGPTLYFVTEYSSMLVIFSLVSMFFLLFTSVVWLVQGNFLRAAKCVISIVIAGSIMLLLGRSGFYLQQGFRLRTAFVNDYISMCNLQEFYASGARQEIGICEIRNQRVVNDLIYVLYDSSGEIARPVSERDQSWRRATEHLKNGSMLANENLPVQNLIGPYYRVSVTIEGIARYM